jgi:exopolyphosphatase/guanosine-5'-triphosphate,3'-diphosphate pyrophosphatase
MIQVILSLFCLKKTIDLASMNRLNTITDQSPPSNMHLFHIPSTRPETVAAVDLGSNSFHMIVASFENNQLKIIDKIKEMVRLGAGLQDDKSLDEATADKAIECLERFGQRLRALPQGAVRAVGTNTLRQVRDNNFLERAQTALGHPIEIIAGREEARLVYLGVANGIDTGDKKRLVIDIGGGSTELIIGKRFKIYNRESLHMGCVSFSRRYFEDGIISKASMGKAILGGQMDIRPVKQQFNADHWNIAIGSSGTIRAIRLVIQEMGWSSKGITRDSLKQLRALMIEQGHVDKLDIKGLSSERKPVFAGGVAVLSALFKSLSIKLMQVSDEALREGLLYEMQGQLLDEDVRDKTVKRLSERYGIDKTQGRRIDTTAQQIYSQVAQGWQLESPEYSELLSWAARLHEVGLTISHSQFQKHSAYILENADMSGFSRQQQRLLSVLVRTHRRKLQGEIFEAQPKDIRESILRLSIILRIAVLLHRGRNNDNKPKLKVRAEENHLHLSFPEDWLKEHPLTTEEMEQEARYLKQVGYGLSFS